MEAASRRSLALEALEVSHAYGPVQALDGVSIQVEAGHVVGLVGANGAGKSTLIRVLTGDLHPDAGELRLDGQTVRLASVRDAAAAGIGVVRQDLLVVPDLTVAQNIFLGEEQPFRTPARVLSHARMEEASRTFLERVGLDVDPSRTLNELSIGDRQLVAAARALRDARHVLLLDEPTSSLSPWETDRLLATIRDIAEQGVAVLYISHRLDEVASLCDSVVVLRDGRTVARYGNPKADLDQIVSAMVPGLSEAAASEGSGAIGEPLLKVVDLAVGRHGPATFQVRAGEILGVFGLIGAGRTTIARALVGLLPADSGSIHLRGESIRPRTSADGFRHGVAYLSENRHDESIFSGMSVRYNIGIRATGVLRRRGMLREANLTERVAELIKQLAIRVPSQQSSIGTLSGGNQQKAVLARLLMEDLDVFVLDEPTHGIDVRAKRDLLRVLRKVTDRGKAVVYISSELPELLSAADRVIVMRKGRVVSELRPEEATEHRIMAAAAGHVGGSSVAQ